VPKHEIQIAGLDEHSRAVGTTLFDTGGRPDGRGKTLKTRRLVCFLERKGVAWHSLSAVGAGSSGLVWIEEDKCYRYQDAAEQIASALPGQIGEGDAYHLYALLSALKALDPARAAPLVDKLIDDPAMKHMRDLMGSLRRH